MGLCATNAITLRTTHVQFALEMDRNRVIEITSCWCKQLKQLACGPCIKAPMVLLTYGSPTALCHHVGQAGNKLLPNAFYAQLVCLRFCFFSPILLLSVLASRAAGTTRTELRGGARCTDSQRRTRRNGTSGTLCLSYQAAASPLQCENLTGGLKYTENNPGK